MTQKSYRPEDWVFNETEVCEQVRTIAGADGSYVETAFELGADKMLDALRKEEVYGPWIHDGKKGLMVFIPDDTEEKKHDQD